MAAPVPGTAVTKIGTTGGPTYTQSYTTQAGETYMIVRVGYRAIYATTHSSSVKFNTTETLTLLGHTDAGSGNQSIEIWGGVVTASLTANVVVTRTGSAWDPIFAIQAYSGVNTGGTPAGTYVGASRTSGGTGTLSVDVTDSTASALIIDALCQGSSDTSTVGGSQTTEFTSVTDPTPTIRLSGSKQTGTAGTVTMTWTSVQIANGNAHLGAVALFGLPTFTGVLTATLGDISLSAAGTYVSPPGGAGQGDAVTRLRYHRYSLGG